MAGGTVPATLTGIASILQAIAWPLVVLSLFLIYRAKFGSLVDVVSSKLEQARHFKGKAWQVELEVDHMVKEEGERAAGEEPKKGIPSAQREAAETVGRKIERAKINFGEKVEIAHRQVYEIIDEYDEVRSRMPSGPLRTVQMNELVAKMRALAVAAYPLLRLLISGDRAGERLAAICILQVRPELFYFDWLVERVMQEDQAFLLFHASLAILELVRSHPYIRPDYASEKIGAALRKVEGFRGGPPDRNTIDLLNEALAQLRTLSVPR